jgi:hypothetical protein
VFIEKQTQNLRKVKIYRRKHLVSRVYQLSCFTFLVYWSRPVKTEKQRKRLPKHALETRFSGDCPEKGKFVKLFGTRGFANMTTEN